MSTAAIQFKPTGWKGYAYSVDGTLPCSGALLTIHAGQRLDEIDLTAHHSGMVAGMRFSAAEARAVAAALVAAAAAVEAVSSSREVCHG